MKNIHVLPTDKPSKIGQSIFDKSLHFNPIFYELEKERVIPQNIYITSDEKVKEGDWVLSFLEDESYGTYFKIEENHFYCGFDFEEDFKKIILTTDPDLIKDGVQAIDDEFLEWFVKNPSCESADIKTENICARCYSNDLNDCWSAKECSDGKFDKIKYKIIIPKKEPILGIDFEMSIDDEGMCVQIPIIKQEILEYNKRCADIIGAKSCKDWQGNDGYEHSMFYHTQWSNRFQDNLQLYSYRYSELQFHSDWNWIMEVVEAIENIEIEEATKEVANTELNRQLGRALDLPIYTKKEAVVQAINQFLIWYNEQV